MSVVTHCARCGLYASPDDKFCGDCGAELARSEAPFANSGSDTAATSAATRLTAFLKDNAALVVTTVLFSAVAFFLVMNGLVAIGSFSDPFAAAVAALTTVAAAISFLAFGARWFAHALIYGSIFVSGGLIFLSFVRSQQIEQTSFSDWRSWIIFSGIFALCVVVLPKLRIWMREGRTLNPRMSALLEEARELQFAQEARLRRLPSHQWYLIATWVTAATMVGSSITTAMGLHSEITDPYDHWLIRFGVPIGLAALASLIIWAGWNFVYLKLRIADTIWRRVAMFSVGMAILTPLTLAIHTVFGIIGVGGIEGLRAHHLWYADVLNAAHDRVEAERESEAGLIQTLELVGTNFRNYMANEVQPGGTGCGAGQGQLYHFYRVRAAESDGLVEGIKSRKIADSELPERLIALRERIVDPGKRFVDAQLELGREFKELRSDILSLQSKSIRGQVKTFLGQLSLLEQEDFFTSWDACQLLKRGEIVQRVRNFRKSIESELELAQKYIQHSVLQAQLRERGERRIESMPFLDRILGYADKQPEAANRPQQEIALPVVEQHEIATFIPLRPFWAVVSYASKLPGYVALQLALDFSPAVFGILFALLAPLPRQVIRGPEEGGGVHSGIAEPPSLPSEPLRDLAPEQAAGLAAESRAQS